MSPSSSNPANPDIIRTNPAITPFKRNPDTGLVEGLTYHYSPDGRIDWRRMVDPRHMYVIREKEAAVVKAQGKALSEVDLSLVDERWLRIKVAGFNQLANLRGYRSLQYHSLISTDSKAAVVCEIEFIGNVETDGVPVICSAIASATAMSTGRDFSPYLETFAENRAFSRAVKRALQINILSDQEVDAEAQESVGGAASAGSAGQGSVAPSAPSGFQPHDVLADKCRNAKPTAITFDILRTAAIKLKTDTSPTAEKPHEPFQGDPSTWTTFEDIQPIDAWFLMGRMEEKAAAKGGKGKGKAS